MTGVAHDPFDALEPGFSTAHEYVITRDVYDAFLAAFGDRNPVHIDDDYARARGFDSRIMHGGILNGFISHFVGMHCPGPGAVIHSVAVQYQAPCHLGDRISVAASISQKSAAVRTLVLELSIFNITRDISAAKGRVQVGVPV